MASSSPSPEPPITSFEPEPWRVAEVPPPAPEGDLSFACPRCGAAVEQPSYGPCGSCREALRTDMRRVGGEVVAPEYVPKMNVTPNAVALKES